MGNKTKHNKKYQDILMRYQRTNEDYGFFCEYKEVFYPLKGIRIISTYENISYTFAEVDYFLLENKRIAKFIKHSSLESSHRELIEDYSITKYKRLYKGKSALKAFQKIEKELLKAQ